MMYTFGTDHITMNEFNDMLFKRGSTFVYAIGDLGYSAGYIGQDTAEIRGLRAMVYSSYEAGDVVLTQKRLPERKFIVSGSSFEYSVTIMTENMKKRAARQRLAA